MDENNLFINCNDDDDNDDNMNIFDNKFDELCINDDFYKEFFKDLKKNDKIQLFDDNDIGLNNKTISADDSLHKLNEDLFLQALDEVETSSYTNDDEFFERKEQGYSSLFTTNNVENVDNKNACWFFNKPIKDGCVDLFSGFCLDKGKIVYNQRKPLESDTLFNRNNNISLLKPTSQTNRLNVDNIFENNSIKKPNQSQRNYLKNIKSIEKEKFGFSLNKIETENSFANFKIMNKRKYNSEPVDQLLEKFKDFEIVTNGKVQNCNNDSVVIFEDTQDENIFTNHDLITKSPIAITKKDFIKYSQNLSGVKQLTNEMTINETKKTQNNNNNIYLSEPLCRPCQIIKSYNEYKSESNLQSIGNSELNEKKKYYENNSEILYNKFCSMAGNNKIKSNLSSNDSFIMRKCSTPYKKVKTVSSNRFCSKIINDFGGTEQLKSPVAISRQDILKYKILLSQNESFNKNDNELVKNFSESFSHKNNDFDVINRRNDSDMELCDSLNDFVSIQSPIKFNQNSPQLFSSPLAIGNASGVMNLSNKHEKSSLSICDYAPYYCEVVLMQHQYADYTNITAKQYFDESLKYDYLTDDQYNDLTENRRQVLLAKIEVVILSIIRDIKNGNDLCLYIKKSTWDDCDVIHETYPARNFKNNIQLREINYYLRKSVNKFPLIIHLLGVIYTNLQNDIFCSRRELYYKNLNLVNYQRTIDAALRDICLLLESPSWELRIFSTIKGLIAGPLKLYTFNREIINCMNLNGGCILPNDINVIKKIVTTAKYIIIVEKDTVFQRLLNDQFFQYLNYECILITGKGYPDTITRLMLQRLKKEFNLPIFALMDADPHGIEIMFTYRYGSLSLHENVTELAVPDIQWLGVYPSEINLLNLSRIKLTKNEMNKLKFMLNRPYVTKKIREEIQILINTEVKAEIESLSNHLISYIGEYCIGKNNKKNSLLL